MPEDSTGGAGVMAELLLLLTSVFRDVGSDPSAVPCSLVIATFSILLAAAEASCTMLVSDGLAALALPCAFASFSLLPLDDPSSPSLSEKTSSLSLLPAPLLDSAGAGLAYFATSLGEESALDLLSVGPAAGFVFGCCEPS
jgi:hypothetical protein